MYGLPSLCWSVADMDILDYYSGTRDANLMRKELVGKVNQLLFVEAIHDYI